MPRPKSRDAAWKDFVASREMCCAQSVGAQRDQAPTGQDIGRPTQVLQHNCLCQSVLTSMAKTLKLHKNVPTREPPTPWTCCCPTQDVHRALSSESAVVEGQGRHKRNASGHAVLVGRHCRRPLRYAHPCHASDNCAATRAQTRAHITSRARRRG